MRPSGPIPVRFEQATCDRCIPQREVEIVALKDESSLWFPGVDPARKHDAEHTELSALRRDVTEQPTDLTCGRCLQMPCHDRHMRGTNELGAFQLAPSRCNVPLEVETQQPTFRKNQISAVVAHWMPLVDRQSRPVVLRWLTRSACARRRPERLAER